MIKKFTKFHYICGACAILLVILVSSPLANLAFNEKTSAEKEETDNTQQTSADKMVANQFVMTAKDEEIPLDLPLYDQYTYNERQAQRLPTALPAVQPFYGEKVVYLTFDDGPDAVNTPKVLEILRQNHIKATFFVTGVAAKGNPEILKQIYAEGHAIGNHSYNHKYRELYRSVHTYLAQLYHNDDIIKQIIGVRPRISRAPGGTVGSFTKEYWDLEKKQGYVDIGWNISSGDASSGSVKAADLVANITQQLDNKSLWSHATVLMHDGTGHAETVKALPEIIKLFKDRGFTFRVVNLYTPPAW